MQLHKKDFPALSQLVHGKPLVYLDSGSSSQKPNCVIDAIAHYYQNNHANVHRGAYELSERATALYEKTRKKIQTFIHAAHTHEIIFTRGTTDSINLVAQSYGRACFKAGDEVILSVMEHHSNIVPWQLLQEQIGIQLKIVPISDGGELDLDAYKKLFSSHTKMVAVTHVSNVLGTVNPLKEIIEIAHAQKVPVLVDGAQAFPHMPIDMQALDCDFYTFSAHKAYGPTGVGVLYGKTKLLQEMPPYQGGGSMIEQVSFEKTTYSPLPHKFEAGTPPISGVVGFYHALDYLEKIGMKTIMQQEQELLAYATERLITLPGLKIVGTAKNKIGVLSFILKDIHPHDIATVLDHEGIAIRAGHHCAMPLMERYQLPAVARVSLGLYNSEEDIDKLIKALLKVQEVFR
ncbi:MAG: sufS [Gammaproteobacteria bacterium]|jgi:cysteine desulfurase/selenocysteine lyase|nr:sufS [Gammaproteobacteria bacterium]MCE3237470.1 sufS [Gammaproteobacteria bacterium]